MIPDRVVQAIEELLRSGWTGQLQLDVRNGRIEKIGRLERERIAGVEDPR